MIAAKLPLPPPPEPSAARPSPQALATALAALDPLPIGSAPVSSEQLRVTLFQWLTVLEEAGIAELAGLTDDLRELANTLPDEADSASEAPATHLRAALHRVGLSLERVAVWGQAAGLTTGMLALGRRLVELSKPEE